MPVQFIGMIATQEYSETIAATGPVVDVEFTRAFARAHEEAGFDRVLIGYFSFAPDGFVVATDVLANTERLGVLLAHRPGFVAPTLAARKLASVDQFSGGRLAVHIISGGSDVEQRRDGDYLDHDGRYRRSDEYLQILRQLWTADGPTDHDGEFYRFEGAFSQVRCASQPHLPIFFGGSSDIAVEVSAKHADVYALWGEPLADAKAHIDKVKAAAARYGRDPGISLSLRPILGRTEEEAWDRAYRILDTIKGRAQPQSRWLGTDGPANVGSQRLLEAASRGDIHDKRLFTALAAATGAAGNSTSLVGTVDQVAESMLDYIDIGVSTLLIRGYDPFDDARAYGDVIRVVGEEVAHRDRQPRPFERGGAGRSIWPRTKMTNHPAVRPATVGNALRNRTEIGLLDVRTEAKFAAGHPLFAASTPLDQLELEASERIPRLATALVVYGEDYADATEAADRLGARGYTNVSLLDGGLARWTSEGRELFGDVNVPSKAFGELVSDRAQTPAIDALDLQALLEQGADVVVADARRFDEYRTMSIPGSISVPGAELVLRIGMVAPDPSTLVVVNCAGRTRSIIGAQSLINSGLPNPVVALRNGTIGWTLAGLTLEHGQDRRPPPVSDAVRVHAASTARLVADRAGVSRISLSELAARIDNNERTWYRFDVRSPDEYARGHLTGFRSAPGGQLVQETDRFAPVRGAAVVVVDDDGVRAEMTASWLAQMGWDAFVVVDGLAGRAQARAGLDLGQVSAPVAARPGPASGTYRRPYEGTDIPTAAMQAYLDWEYGLVDQLERDGTHGFTVLKAS